MKANRAFLIILLLAVNIMATSLVVTADITTDTIWDTDTVLINKEYFEVKENARLTIAPGTHVVFLKDISIITVKGTISAIGALNDSIYITRKNPTDSWQGIRLVSRNRSPFNPDTSFFEYCSLRNAFYFPTDVLYQRQGGILYSGAGNYVSVRNCTIADVQGDIGGAVFCDSGSTVKVKNSCFTRNKTERNGAVSGGGAIMTCDSGIVSLSVENCRFDYNSSRNGGAVRIGNGTSAEFNNCIFYRDSTYKINPGANELCGGALAIFGKNTVITLRNCLMYFCSSYLKGGAIYSYGAILKVINCTIVQNSSTYGGGCSLNGNSFSISPTFINTIIDGNGTVGNLPRDSAGCGVYLDSLAAPVFKNCHMNDTVYNYKVQPLKGELVNSKYCLTDFAWAMNPKISDTTPDGYQLYKYDSAIDAGTADTSGLGLPEFDLAGNKRINGTTIDIGAFEYYKGASTLPYTLNRKSLPMFTSGEMAVYTFRGQKLKVFKSNSSFETVQEFVRNKYPSGIYLVTLSSSGKLLWSKNILVK